MTDEAKLIHSGGEIVLEMPTDEEVPQDVQDIIDGLGVPSKSVRLYRKPKRGTGRFGYLETLETATFTLDDVRDQWGGGVYQIQFLNEDGKYIKGSARTFAIDGLPRDPEAPRGERGEGGETVDMLREILRDQRERSVAQDNSKTMELAIQIAQITQANQAPAVDPMQVGTQIAKMILDATAGRGNDGPDFNQMIDLFTKGLEAGQMGGGDEGYGSVIRAFLPTLQKLAEKETPPAGGDTSGHAPPAQALPGSAPPAGPQPPRTEPAAIAAIRPFLPQLLTLAELKKNTQIQAALILDMLDAGQVELLATAVEDPDAFRTVFYQYVEEAKQFASWFDSLIGNLHAGLFSEVPEPEPEPETPPQD